RTLPFSSSGSSCFSACGDCGRPFSTERNLALERLAEIVPFPCVFQCEGCVIYSRLDSKIDHEEFCSFQLLGCPFCPAKLRGRWKTLAQHLASEHPLVKSQCFPVQIPASTEELCRAVKLKEPFEEFTVLQHRGRSSSRLRRHAVASAAATPPAAPQFPDEGEIFVLAVCTRPEHDSVLYTMRAFRAKTVEASAHYRLTFASDGMSTLSYAGVVQAWVARKNDVANKGNSLALPSDFFLNSLNVCSLEVELILDQVSS
ncbi:unnamed protein product, partial [Notodromas monacha]